MSNELYFHPSVSVLDIIARAECTVVPHREQLHTPCKSTRGLGRYTRLVLRVVNMKTNQQHLNPTLHISSWESFILAAARRPGYQRCYQWLRTALIAPLTWCMVWTVGQERSVILISRPRALLAVNEALCSVNKAHYTRCPPRRPPVACPRISPFVPITPATLSECHHPLRRGVVPYRQRPTHRPFPRNSRPAQHFIPYQTSRRVLPHRRRPTHGPSPRRPAQHFIPHQTFLISCGLMSCTTRSLWIFQYSEHFSKLRRIYVITKN